MTPTSTVLRLLIPARYTTLKYPMLRPGLVSGQNVSFNETSSEGKGEERRRQERTRKEGEIEDRVGRVWTVRGSRAVGRGCRV